MTKVLNPAWKIVIIIQVPSKFQSEMKESEISKLIIITTTVWAQNFDSEFNDP